MGCGSSTLPPSAPSDTAHKAPLPANHNNNNANANNNNNNNNDTKTATNDNTSNKSNADNQNSSPDSHNNDKEDANNSNNSAASTDKNKVNKAIHEVGHVVSIGNTVASGLSSASHALVGAIGSKNPDGTYTLKETVGPIDLATGDIKKAATSLLFVVSESAKFFDAARIALQVLEKLYNMWNACSSKSQWCGEFMLFLKNVEHDIHKGREVFRKHDYLDKIEKELNKVKSKMDVILKRNLLSSFIFSLSDQATLIELKAGIDNIKKQALQHMMIEIKSDTDTIESDVKDMLNTLQANEVITKKQIDNNLFLQQLSTPIDYLPELEMKYARYCQGTRLSVLRAFEQFSTISSDASFSESHDRVFLLSGGAGVGKSVVSSYMCYTYKNIVAIHYCNAHSDARRSMHRIIKNIVYQLCVSIPSYQRWILDYFNDDIDGEERRKNMRLNNVKNINKFFDELIVAPLKFIDKKSKNDASLLPTCVQNGNKCIVLIDAIDEISSSSSASSSNDNELLKILAQSGAKLPHWFSFMLTSRPETLAHTVFERYDTISMELSSEENTHDLTLYLTKMLTPLIAPLDLQSAIQLLIRKSEGMFLYASMVLESAVNNNHGQTQELSIKDIQRFPDGMSAYYLTQFHAVRASYEAKHMEFDNLIKILRIIMAAAEPMSIASIHQLTNISCEDITALLTPLRSLLPLSHSENNNNNYDELRVMLYHRSIRDWLCDPNRQNDSEECEYYVDIIEGHKLLKDQCHASLIGSSSASNFVFPNHPKLNSSDILSSSNTSLLHYCARYVCYHLLQLGEWSDILLYLMNLQYIEIRCRMHEGYSFLKDLNETVKSMERGQKKLQYFLGTDTPFPVATKQQCTMLQQFKRFVQGEIFFFTKDPHLIYPYAYSYPSTHPAHLCAANPSLYAVWSKQQAWCEWVDKPQVTDHIVETFGSDVALTCVQYCTVPGVHRLISGGEDASIQVWNTQSGELSATWKGHTARINSLYFTNNGKYVVSTSMDQTIRVWSVHANTCISLLTPKLPTNFLCVCFSTDPNGKYIVVGAEDGNAYVFDRESSDLKCTLSGHTGPINSIAFSHPLPNSPTFIVTGSSDHTVRVWPFDAHSGQVSGSRVLEAHTGKVRAVTIAFNNNLMASGSNDMTIKLWNIMTGIVIYNITGHHGAITSLDFSSDANSTRLASSSEDESIRLWYTDTGKLQATFTGHHEPITCVSFSPSSRRLASCSADHYIKIFDVEVKNNENDSQPCQCWNVSAVTFSHDGNFILCGSQDKTVRSWYSDATNMELYGTFQAAMYGHTGIVTGIQHANQYIVSTSQDGELISWNAVSHQLANKHMVESHIIYLAVSHSQRIVAVVTQQQVIKFFALNDDGRFTPQQQHECVASVLTLAFSKDDDYLQVLLSNRSLVKLNVVADSSKQNSTTSLSSVSSSDSISVAQFSSDTRLLACIEGSQYLRVYSTSSGALTHEISVVLPQQACITWSNDDSTIAFSGREHQLILFNINTLQFYELYAHFDSITCVSWNPTRPLVMTGSLDNLIACWDVSELPLQRNSTSQSNKQAQVIKSPITDSNKLIFRFESARGSNESVHVYKCHIVDNNKKSS